MDFLDMAVRLRPPKWSIGLFGAVFLAVFGFIAQADAADTADAQKVNLHALVAGISEYKDPKLNLKLAAKDSKDIAAFLSERKHLFASQNVTLLLDHQATKAAISGALDRLKVVDRDDIVLIYLSGHGTVRDSLYYFAPHDMDLHHPADTGLLMSDQSIFRDIKSERVLLVADSCHSGGYLSSLERGIRRTAREILLQAFSKYGRFGISAAGPEELAVESPKYNNGMFTYFFLKGLRGSAHKTQDGVVTVRSLYDYVASSTAEESHGRQNPLLFSAKGQAETTPVFMAPVYERGLTIDLKFFYEDENGNVKLLTEDSILKSGQRVGVAFKPHSPCYVQILWWDTSGQVGRLFPNPKLTEGTGEVEEGRTYWLPMKNEGKYWYVLDDKPGYETIYFIASRERNPKLEQLYQQLQGASGPRDLSSREEVTTEIEGEINLMGVADYDVSPRARELPYSSKEKLFQDFDSKVTVSGVDAFHKLRFKHEQR
jgi:hypothetical protein